MPFGSITPLFAQKSGHYKLISFNIRYNVASSEIGVGRNDGKKAGECMAVFFLANQFELLESGTRWLSATPENVSRDGTRPASAQ